MRAVLLVAILCERAHADGDIRDQFGLHHKEAPTCDDVHTLGCPWPDALAEPTAYALSTTLSREYLDRLPLGDPTHDQLASLALGATTDGAGTVFGSGNGLENRWTLDGAPIDNGATGGAETRIPLAFLQSMTMTAGGFSARDRASLGGTIDAQLLRGTATHVGSARYFGSLTLDAAHRPDVPGTYQFRTLTGELGPGESGAVTMTGPITGGAWYAAGIAFSGQRTDLTARANALVDANHDNLADLDANGRFVLEPLENRTTKYFSHTYNALARAGWDGGPHHLDLTLLGSLAQNSTLLAQSSDSASAIDRNTWVGDAIATYRGAWTDTHLKLQAGWHRSMVRAEPRDDSSIQLLSTYVPDQPACVDDPNTTFTHCPINTGFFASGGAGLLVDTTIDRPFLSADLTHRIDNHTLRIGATGEDTRYVIDSRFTGGEQIRSLFPGHQDVLRYFSGDCGANPTDSCNYQSSQELNYRTRYTAAYVEDTFQPAKNLRVDAGLRWELMWVGAKLHFSDELSPRLGMTWGFLDNHGVAFASLGRSFAMLPAGLGQTVSFRNATVSDVTVAGLGSGRSIDRGNATLVAPDIQPAAQDEATVGLTFGYPKTVQLTMWLQGRSLERGLDTTPTGFDNPGTNGDLPAQRNSVIFATEVATSGNPTLRLGYQYGRAWGTWTGAYDPRQGAVLYAGDLYDSGSINLNGRLPSNQGHRVYVEGERRGHLFGLDVGAALRLTLASGRPRDAVADTSEGTYFLIGRGDAGTGAMLSQANLRLSARWHGVVLTFDVLNLFDRRDATNVDSVYTQDSVLPISGGEQRDLVWLRNVNGVPALRSRTYGDGVSFQSPLSFVLGLRDAF